MSEIASEEPVAAAKPAAELDLAVLTAGKLCHDFIGQAGAIISGLDLLEDETAADMRDDALAMIAASARKLGALIEFDRVAYGGSSGAEVFGAAELERLTQGVFAPIRAELDWRIEAPELAKIPAKAAINLAQIVGGALITGGQVKVRGGQSGSRFLLSIEGTGPRVRLKAEALAGLKGESYGEGLAGQWIQAALVHRLVSGAGGRVIVDLTEERLRIGCEIPLDATSDSESLTAS